MVISRYITFILLTTSVIVDSLPRGGHDHMVVIYATAYAITTKVVSSNPDHGKIYLGFLHQ